jgi:hypothetical protein
MALIKRWHGQQVLKTKRRQRQLLVKLANKDFAAPPEWRLMSPKLFAAGLRVEVFLRPNTKRTRAHANRCAANAPDETLSPKLFQPNQVLEPDNESPRYHHDPGSQPVGNRRRLPAPGIAGPRAGAV